MMAVREKRRTRPWQQERKTMLGMLPRSSERSGEEQRQFLNNLHCRVVDVVITAILADACVL